MEAKVETAQLDPERLRFITRSVQNKQGLTAAACGVMLCTFDADKFDIPRILSFLLSAAGFGLYFAAFSYLPKYYRRRFGWIAPAKKKWTRSGVLLFGAFLLALLLLMIFWSYTVTLGHFASNQLHLWFSDPQHHLNFAPVSLWLAYLCLHLWRRLRHPNQGDPNLGYFVGAGVFAWAFVAFYPLQHPNVLHLAFWRILNTCWFGLSFMALGFYEHLTLVLLLPKRIPEDDDNNDE